MVGCGKKTRLNAHHIHRWADAPWLRFSVDNGITLCSNCHNKINGHEQAFAMTFFNIVQRNKHG